MSNTIPADLEKILNLHIFTYVNIFSTRHIYNHSKIHKGYK